MRNFFVDYRSGASTRPGTEYIRSAAPGAKKVRLVRFQQSVDVTYVLEFGDHYLRFVSNGASIVQPGIPISNITQASPGIVTAAGLITGSTVFISGVQGMPQVNNRYFYVAGATATTFILVDALTLQAVDTINYDPYVAGGLAQVVYTIQTPYGENELALLKFSQNASVMNITHPAHTPHTLTLITATDWQLAAVIVGATIDAPGLPGVEASTPGAVSYKYAVTGVDENGQESPPSPVIVIATASDLRTVAGTNLIAWSPVPGAVSYNVYGSSPSYQPLMTDTGGLGFVGSVPGANNGFIDSNVAADFSQTPPIHDNPFSGVNPAVSSYFQQRLVFANGGGQLVATFWASKTGAPYNFDFSNPTQADDAITGALVSLEVNEIKSLVPMPTGLVALTTKGAWIINGGAGGVATQGGPITPTTATATPQAYIGANDVPPIVVNYDILFIQQKGSVVRDLTFNIYANIYTGNDISIMSSHLFYGHQILEWAYAEEPFKTVWCVREDGILLSLTLVKEQDMYGWARHDTLGNFKSVCTVTEGTTDATYFAVERPNPTGVGTYLSIERLADRTFPFGAEDAWCVDAGVKTTSIFPQASLTVSAATGNVTMTANIGIFQQDVTDWVVRLGGGIIKVTGVVNTFNATGIVIQPITDTLPNDPLKRPDIALAGTWSIDKPFTKVFGLDHLEGRPVAVLADGGVINGLVVHNGSITLPSPVTKVIAGYAYQAQLQTMYLDLGQEVNSVQGKRKKLSALTVRCKDSRGVKAGMTFETVTPIKELNRVTQLGFPISLVTADERIIMDPLWDIPGQICLQVDDPLPATVLGVIPEVVVGDSQK
jgi:hypothetical protein